MGFQSLAEMLGRRPTSDQFRIGVEKRVISFKPPLPMLEKLGWFNGTKIDIGIGDGDDLGSIELRQDKDGWALGPTGGKSKSMAVKVPRRGRGLVLPGLPDEFPSAQTRSELRGDTIIAWLPWSTTADPAAPAREGQPDAARQAKVEPEGAAGLKRETLTTVSEPVSARPVPFEAPVRPDPSVRTNNPETWPADVRERFIEAASRYAGSSELSAICGRPKGSVIDITRRYLKDEIEARRQQHAAAMPEPAATVDAAEEPPEANGSAVDGGDAVAEVNAGPAPGRTERQDGPVPDDTAGRAGEAGGSPASTGKPFPVQARSIADADRRQDTKPSGFKVGSLPPAPKPITRVKPEPERMVPRRLEPQAPEPPPAPRISDETLAFLRNEVAPILMARKGARVSARVDSGVFLLNDKPVELQLIIDEANRILVSDGEPKLETPFVS